MEHNAKWQVSLNNGQTFYEGKGDFVSVTGDTSPWNKLQKYISDNDLKITSLSLYTDSGQRFNLPSLGANPKFRPFDVALKPSSYMLERRRGMDINIDSEDLFTTIVCFYDYNNTRVKLSLWVDEKNTNNVWTLMEIQ